MILTNLLSKSNLILTCKKLGICACSKTVVCAMLDNTLVVFYNHSTYQYSIDDRGEIQRTGMG